MKLFICSYFLFLIVQFISLQQKKPIEQSIADGEEIYQDFCLQCHLSNGEGVSGIYPPLANSDYLFDDIDRSIRNIKYGLSGPIIVNDEEYNAVMLNNGLDDEEISDVMNYILNSWGNKTNEMITKERVAKISK
ncbi:MAG: cytochrome c [Flavobacteriaceae bacterium TMED121]|nr:MAG: cytochrome c [Flavobacteriaceae bacterium TMED121]|tara:strand:- start:880 stop:1281 length:402 start_codon:yes stop_codon:yes gene_type:complete